MLISFIAQLCGLVCLICVPVASGDEVPIHAAENAKEGPSKPLSYKEIFKERRKQHDATIQQLLTHDHAKQYEVLGVVLPKLMHMLGEHRDVLTNAGAYMEESKTANATLLQALSSTAEKLAFFGDVLLHLPNPTHQMVDKHPTWKPLIMWAMTLCNQTEIFADEPGQTLLSLMSQELGFEPRSENYFNPYRHSGTEKSGDSQAQGQPAAKSTKKPRKKLKRGPRLTRSDL